ncbi:E3 ubiquitin-protein ligase PUB23 [Brachypodium distachyon]|uniref:U-box domain-containing protein n=1 Tax=Brachypodium distachyon TaxID=15368 RepID=A0A0Q3HV78_BRADI|nr:E3 ubiquitin-protein ligase PUB23 [Brachypodium distachyon]KQJ92155.1 hypothetical protein BRADI_4g41951v3 [Brachypodium distachyon]|eukprot:XP_010239497.2 E3 ubiquitin-protein ligase PUB23 [Brachypodium distachyon]
MGTWSPAEFVCPISMTRMQDPVTAPSGVTYERGAIERWLAAGHTTCPVSGHGPLSLADLVPNLTLQRLILSWKPSHAAPPPNPLAKLVQKVMATEDADVLREAAAMAAADARARRRMLQCQGVSLLPRVLRLLVSAGAGNVSTGSPTEKKNFFFFSAACLALVDALGVSADEIRPLLEAEPDVLSVGLVDALTGVLLVTLEEEEKVTSARQRAARLMESVTAAATRALLELLRLHLRPDLFRALKTVLRDRDQGTTRAALQTVLNLRAARCDFRLAAESGFVHELIELIKIKLSAGNNGDGIGSGHGDATMTRDLAMEVLSMVCGRSAEARAAVAGHAAGIAAVARHVRARGCSPAAVRVLASVCGSGAAPETVREMARVGAVGKLCCVLQSPECHPWTKEMATRVLRLHAEEWARSPCVRSDMLYRCL